MLLCCGLNYLNAERKYDLAMAALRRAFELNPNNFEATIFLGIGNIHCGSLDAALTSFRRALRLSPVHPEASSALTGIAHVHMILGDYATAISHAARSLTFNGNFNPTGC